MTVGVARERYPGERRVALVPAHIGSLTKQGIEVVVERDAGAASGYLDGEYTEKGASLSESRDDVTKRADILLTVRWAASDPQRFEADIDHLKPGAVVLGFMEPFDTDRYLDAALAKRVSALSVELIPRITRAQSMDALSSMANLAGYKAALIAADNLPRMFPMMMTAAGTITPARVLVIGVGVAGLQAIATAKRLGGVVSAYDIRPAVREQVESLGARFVEVPLDTGASETSGGYAREMNEEFYRRQRELMSEVVAESNVVITTAAVPGRTAPILVTTEMVEGMAPGSVLVDLAAERGGNCELTRAGETVVHRGVTILGPVNVPSSLAYHASQLYSKNLVTILGIIVKNGVLHLDVADEVIKASLVTHEGAVISPAIAERTEAKEE